LNGKKKKKTFDNLEICWKNLEAKKSCITSKIECIKTSNLNKIRVASVAQVDKELDQSENRKKDISCCMKNIQEITKLFNDSICKYSSLGCAEKIVIFAEEQSSTLKTLQKETNYNIEKLQELKERWFRLNDLMRSLDEWIQLKYSKIPKLEQSNEDSEQIFVKLQKIMNSISTKEIEINNVEKMCSEIQGVENPSTLNANLANLRSKWQQLSNRVESLKTRMEEYISHQKRFDFLRIEIDKMLLDSEFSLKKIEETRPEVTCSEDLEKIKNSVSNLEHSTEAIRSFINSLQSEAKLLKDPNSVENTKSNVNIRFSNLMNKFKEYYKVLDAVTIKWQKVDKEISAIENFIEKCSLLTTTGNLEPGGLPGDQQKLKFELETLEKYNNSILTQKNNIDDLTETMNEISLLLPIDYDMTYNKIEKMRQKLIELPKQLVERNRIVTSALESHVIYSEAVEIFTLWLISFERLLRQNTNICLDDVTEAKQQTEVA